MNNPLEMGFVMMITTTCFAPMMEEIVASLSSMTTFAKSVFAIKTAFVILDTTNIFNVHTPHFF